MRLRRLAELRGWDEGNGEMDGALIWGLLSRCKRMQGWESKVIQNVGPE